MAAPLTLSYAFDDGSASRLASCLLARGGQDNTTRAMLLNTTEVRGSVMGVWLGNCLCTLRAERNRDVSPHIVHAALTDGTLVFVLCKGVEQTRK